MSSQNSDLSDLIKHLRRLGERQDRVSVHDIRKALGERSFGPFLAIPALIEITPIGGIPGLPTVIALVIALVATQILFGRAHLWLPDFLERRTLRGDRVKKGMEGLKACGLVRPGAPAAA